VKVPKVGPTARRRAQKARVVTLAERAVKSLVKDMDGRRCRWPDCEVPPLSFWGQLQAAHYKAEGMGGDPNLVRCTVDNMLAACRWHHRGPRGLHSGLAKMEPLTELGTRGPVQFSVMERGEGGRWSVIGVTSPPKEWSE
jgi:hypothetical protein